jgi:hypothetical protein
MNRTRQIITLILITVVAIIAFIAFLTVLEDNKRDISEVGVGGGGGGGVGQTSEDTESLGGSHVKEVVQGKGAEKDRDTGKKEDQIKIAASKDLKEFKGKGDKHTQALLSITELHKKFPQKGEPLPSIFKKQVEKIDGVSKNTQGTLFYSNMLSQNRIADSLRKQDFDVSIDDAGNITGRTIKYEIMIHHIP